MNIRAPNLDTKAFAYAATLAACALLSGPIQAEEPIVTVKASVSTAGLDVGQPAGARALYGRLRHAAIEVCGSGMRVGLRAVDDFAGCIETAVAEAVRSAHLPQLTLEYLKTHTLQQAVNHRIDVPVLTAAK
jgi:UrcA family protein